MPLIVDAHADLAWNMLTYGRDYLLSAKETRQREAGSETIQLNGDTLLGWPDYQRGQVAVIFSTLFVAPARWRTSESETQVYASFADAQRLCRGQVEVYQRLTDSHPDKFRMIRSRSQLEEHLDQWGGRKDNQNGKPVGLVLLMEGAEGIRELSELAEWYDLGLRIIGPAWVGTRYCGGWREPGPLTQEGRELISAMADFNFILDVSHMDEQAALEVLDSYEGPVIATHGNCLALLPDYPTNRQFTDRLIGGVIERDGVIGVVPFNLYLKVGWKRGNNLRDEVHLTDLLNHIDHICQMAGDALHAGLGSDFDGGFGLQSAPAEIETIADLQKLIPLLAARGYSDADTTNILGGNWLTRLKRDLPS